MRKIMIKLKDKHCPICHSTNIHSNGDWALCKGCRTITKPKNLKCHGTIIKHNGYKCKSCKLLLTCTSCGSKDLRFNGSFVCQKCNHSQTSREIHDKDHHSKRYIEKFKSIMHTYPIKSHLSKTNEGKQLLHLIQNIRRDSDRVAVAAFAYRNYCRNYPVSSFTTLSTSSNLSRT